MKKIFIVSNDKYYIKNKSFYNSNKNTYTIINSVNTFLEVYLVARKIFFKPKFNTKLNNVFFIKIRDLFNKGDKIKNSKALIVSLTPFNFFASLTLILMGIKKKNFYLFLRSDGFEEYRIKYGKLGVFTYWIMLNIIKNKLNILSCSRSLTGNFKFRLIFPSEIDEKWLKKRKISRNKKTNISKANLLYIGRFRKEKGYLSIINIFKKLPNRHQLTMIGNDQKYLKENNYPQYPNIKIFGQITKDNALINYYDKNDILILPSYIEAYPQVILESLARLKPIIIFNEIKYLKKTFKYGLFNCDRNKKSLELTIIKIMNNYQNIQKKIAKEKIFTQKNFFSNMENIFKS